MFGSGIGCSHKVFGSHAHARHRRRLHGKWLGLRIPFGRHIASRDRLFFDTEYGLSSEAIKDEYPAHFACLRESRDLLSILHNFEKTWGRRKVVVPNFVMYRLEIPLELSGFGVDRDDRVAEQIITRPIATIHIRAGAAYREVNKAALFIDSESKGPNVVAGPIFPTVESPGLISRLSFARDRMELPELFSGARIIRVRVAGLARACIQLGSDVPLAGPVEVRPHQNDVFIDRGRAVVWDFEFDFAVVAKAGRRLAGYGVDGNELPCRCEENPWRIVLVTRPIGDAPERRLTFFQFKAPDFFSRFRLERDNPIGRGQVHDAIHDNRCDFLKDFARALSGN